MNILDLIYEILVQFLGLKILKFFDADPDPGSCRPWIRDGKVGSRINIPYPQHWLDIINLMTVTNIYGYQPCKRKQPSSWKIRKLLTWSTISTWSLVKTQVIFILNLILVCLNVHCNENDRLQNGHYNNLDQYDPLAYLIIAVFPTGMLALLREVWLAGMSEIITCLLSLQETPNLQEWYHIHS